MRSLRQLVAVIVLAIAPLAGATSWSTDISDLWWNPDESGWGMQIVQTYDTAFVTIYVYRPDRSPVWYSATIKGPIANLTGDLYETSGPWFGGPFSPSGVGVRKVGTFRFQSTSIADANVTYTVDGTPVTKAVERQILVNENNNGLFRGAMNALPVNANCGLYTTGRGLAGEVQISQPNRGRAMALTLRVGTESCTMTDGDYLQFGRFGDVYGTFACASGDRGTLSVYEMQAGYDTFTARFEYKSTVTGCTLDGDFAGVRM